MAKGTHSETLLLLALFYPCDYCVIPSPFDLDFGTLDFGTSDSGLTIVNAQVFSSDVQLQFSA